MGVAVSASVLTISVFDPSWTTKGQRHLRREPTPTVETRQGRGRRPGQAQLRQTPTMLTPTKLSDLACSTPRPRWASESPGAVRRFARRSAINAPASRRRSTRTLKRPHRAGQHADPPDHPPRLRISHTMGPCRPGDAQPRRPLPAPPRPVRRPTRFGRRLKLSPARNAPRVGSVPAGTRRYGR